MEIILYDSNGEEIKVENSDSNEFTIEIPLKDPATKLNAVTCAYVTTLEQKEKELKEAASKIKQSETNSD